jgi:glutamate racemase
MKNKIGLFDSGLGGLTVLKEIKNKSPNLNIFYFGDNLNAPYGQKSQEEIIELTRKAFKFLKKQKCQKIVTACNSVSAILTKELAREAGYGEGDIIEMSEPTVQACSQKKIRNILILSTEATKKSGLYTEQFKKAKIESESLSINGLVDLIENNSSDLEKEKLIKRELKKDKSIFAKIQNGEFKNIILACTHFPLSEGIFQKVFSEQARLVPNFINPAIFVAEEVFKKFGNSGERELEFYFSGNRKNIKDIEKIIRE